MARALSVNYFPAIRYNTCKKASIFAAIRAKG